MTGRVLASARCRKGHVVAELVATRDGLRVRVPVSAVGHMTAGRVHYYRGDEVAAPLLDDDGEPSVNYLGICGCGRAHMVSGRELAAAGAAGSFVRAVPLR